MELYNSTYVKRGKLDVPERANGATRETRPGKIEEVDFKTSTACTARKNGEMSAGERDERY